MTIQVIMVTQILLTQTIFLKEEHLMMVVIQAIQMTQVEVLILVKSIAVQYLINKNIAGIIQ